MQTNTTTTPIELARHRADLARQIRLLILGPDLTEKWKVVMQEELEHIVEYYNEWKGNDD